MAGTEDPIETVERIAREHVLRAFDAGWQGPPFNPLGLADLLKIPVEASAAVPDARTVPHAGWVKIEFNPAQSRARLRFSIAHEVAHTIFPDVAAKVRNRSAKSSADEWQLEMLCNIAAAEFIMPIGSLPPADQLPRIEDLMLERRRFDVSTEAFLIRMVRVASEPILMFCATLGDKGSNRLDYVVPSRGWPPGLTTRHVIPTQTVATECTAIGFTARGEETWPGLGRVTVECVGIPQYPNTPFSRVAGLIRSLKPNQPSATTIKYVHGTVFEPRGDGPRLICQLVNDSARRWGGGVASEAARRFPKANTAFSKWIAALQKSSRLGEVHFCDIGHGCVLASLVAQHGFGPSTHPRIRYSALERCLVTIREEVQRRHYSVHMPRIGTGAAGGDWQLVEQLVVNELVPSCPAVTVYDLPPKGLTPNADLFD